MYFLIGRIKFDWILLGYSVVYIITGLFFSYLSFVEIFARKFQNSKISLFIVLFILVLPSSVRYQVGSDWYNYLEFYNNNSTAEFGEDFPFFLKGK